MSFLPQWRTIPQGMCLFKHLVINFCFYQSSSSFYIESTLVSGLEFGLFFEEDFCPRLFTILLENSICVTGLQEEES